MQWVPGFSGGLLQGGFRQEAEPVKPVRSEGQHVLLFGNRRKPGVSEYLHRHEISEFRKIEMNELDKAGKVDHHKDAFFFVASNKCENLLVFREKEFQVPPAERPDPSRAA